MSKPVVKFVFGDLFLVASIRFHAPDLHRPGPVGVEVYEFPIGGVFGTIIEALGGGKSLFLTAFSGNRVNVEFRIAFGAIGQSRTIRRPPVPIGRSKRCDLLRSSTFNGHGIDYRLAAA